MQEPAKTIKNHPLQPLSDQIGDNQFAKLKGECVECGEEFTMEIERTGPNGLDIKNGAVYKTAGEFSFKCQNCFVNNPNAGPKVEVYSRVVGYLRPVSNWNDVKQAEFKSRKMYQIPEEI